MALTLILRVGYLPVVGFAGDLQWNAIHAERIVFHGGLFQLYATIETDYPPLYMTVLGAVGTIQTSRGSFLLTSNLDLVDTFEITLMKLIPFLCEVGIILAIYFWLRDKPRFQVLLTAFFALSPGLIMDVAWWGQSDAVMTFFLVIALIALNQRKWRYVWIFFAIAMLTKFQSVALFPLLLVVSFRRFGWRKTLVVIAISAGILLGGLSPFIIGSGWDKATAPYLHAVGGYRGLTISALNLWYVITPHSADQPLHWIPNPDMTDDIQVLPGITLRMVGLLFIAAYAIGLMTIVWRQANQNREFLWGAAIYLAFFILPTEVHERYIFLAAVMLIIAIAQDRRVWLPALVIAYTMAYNLIQVMDNVQYGGWLLWSRGILLLVAIINIVVLVQVTYLVWSSPEIWQPLIPLPPWLKRFLKRVVWVIRSIGIATAVLIVSILIRDGLTYGPVAHWLWQNIPPSSHLIIEDPDIANYTQPAETQFNWTWKLVAAIETQTPQQWLSAGADYLIVNENNLPDQPPYQVRLRYLLDHGATLRYESPSILGLTRRSAVLSTSRP